MKNILKVYRARQKGRSHPQGPEKFVAGTWMDKGGKQYPVLAEISAQGGKCAQAEGSREHEPEDPGQVLVKVSHFENVVFIGEGLDHASGAQKEERFKKGVGKEVKHSAHDVSRAHGQDHVPHLAHGGIGQHPLDVPLGQGRKGRVKGGDRPDTGDDQHSDR